MDEGTRVRTYAGIGSRETPVPILQQMATIAEDLATLGYLLRSGGARGADQAFERGAARKKGSIESFKSVDATPEAIALSARFHPGWAHVVAKGPYVVGLHGRNAMIVAGRDLKTPVAFVVCWTKDGRDSGGTGQAIRIALGYNIRIYNLFYAESRVALGGPAIKL